MDKELLTVKEYAEIKGCSTQYVYRILQTKLQPFVVVVNGQKYIKSSVFNAEEEKQPTNETNQTNQVSQSNFKSSSFTEYEELKRVLKRNEELVDSLREEIKNKDTQLAQLNDKIISLFETNQRLMENNQQLQLNYQLLLGDGKTKPYEEVNVESAGAEEIVEEQPKKKGFFSRIFK